MEEPKRIYTTICIKRRISGEPGPPKMLQHGELAMNEINSTLYVGTSNTQDLSGGNTATDMGNF